MDAAEYKHVVLGLIFLKYISDAFEEAHAKWSPSATRAPTPRTPKMPRTSWKNMAQYELAVPPKGIAEAFGDQIRPSVNRIVSAIHASRSLATQRDALLPRLVAGELPIRAK